MRSINHHVRRIVNHPLFSGSFIMMIGSNLTNLLAYIYHFIVGRMLGPSQYSELSSLVGILTIFFTTLTLLGTVVIKFVSADSSETSEVFRWFRHKMYVVTAVVFVVSALSTPLISRYLHINAGTVFLIVPIAVLGIWGMLFKSYVQGKLRFKEFTISINIDLIVRLLASVVAIYLGFKVFGAFSGYLMGSAVSVLYLKNITDKSLDNKVKEKGIDNLKQILLFSLPVFATSLATNALLSSDVIMVKHFLDPHDAGIYSSLSTLGRVIFYATAPIGAVMFPVISKNYSLGKKYMQYFYISFLLVLSICVGVVLAYLFLPRLAIGILFGRDFLDGIHYLIWFGIFNSVFTLAQLFISFFLSIERTKITYLSLFSVLVQIVGINIFHSSIIEIVHVSIVSCSLLLLGLIIYFLYAAKTRKI